MKKEKKKKWHSGREKVLNVLTDTEIKKINYNYRN